MFLFDPSRQEEAETSRKAAKVSPSTRRKLRRPLRAISLGCLRPAGAISAVHGRRVSKSDADWSSLDDAAHEQPSSPSKRRERVMPFYMCATGFAGDTTLEARITAAYQQEWPPLQPPWEPGQVRRQPTAEELAELRRQKLRQTQAQKAWNEQQQYVKETSQVLEQARQSASRIEARSKRMEEELSAVEKNQEKVMKQVEEANAAAAAARVLPESKEAFTSGEPSDDEDTFFNLTSVPSAGGAGGQPSTSEARAETDSTVDQAGECSWPPGFAQQ
eukprot:TRINITY_DN88434_c0_g1_i1.p1 TRINITY_DN88434_c0_g1~~TRINITY_DN88434_c0_g1_i1.p1  ORF type:complete len:275 (+),score=69.32 TRINITY_DN88434_c0_g1_i1:85-909(+)